MKRLLLAAAFLSACSSVSAAEPVCRPREAQLQIMAQIGETRVAWGFNESGVMELFAGRDGTWTLVLSPDPTTSCFMAFGGAFDMPGGAAALIFRQGEAI